MGVNYSGWQLARWEFSWAKNFSGGNCPGWELSSGSYPGWEFFEWELSGWELSWVESFRLGIVRVLVILGGSFLRWEFSGWELSGGNHPGGNFHVTIMKYQTIMFNDSSFISLSQVVAMTQKAFSDLKSLKFCTATSAKDTHQIPQNQISVAKSLNLVFSSIENNNLKD